MVGNLKVSFEGFEDSPKCGIRIADFLFRILQLNYPLESFYEDLVKSPNLSP
jgi:hypothetical protein